MAYQFRSRYYFRSSIHLTCELTYDDSKEQFDIRGKESTAGFVSRVGSIAQDDSLLIKLMRDAGAVFYCKTNNPQTLMHLETTSNGTANSRFQRYHAANPNKSLAKP